MVAPNVQSRSDRDLATTIAISPSFIYKYITLFEQTGDLKPKSYRHGPPKLLGDMEQLFPLRVLLSQPGVYLGEIHAKLVAKYGVPVDVSTTLKYMGCTRKLYSEFHYSG